MLPYKDYNHSLSLLRLRTARFTTPGSLMRLSTYGYQSDREVTRLTGGLKVLGSITGQRRHTTGIVNCRLTAALKNYVANFSLHILASSAVAFTPQRMIHRYRCCAFDTAFLNNRVTKSGTQLTLSKSEL